MDLEIHNMIFAYKNFSFPISILKKGNKSEWLFCLLNIYNIYLYVHVCIFVCMYLYIHTYVFVRTCNICLGLYLVGRGKTQPLYCGVIFINTCLLKDLEKSVKVSISTFCLQIFSLKNSCNLVPYQEEREAFLSLVLFPKWRRSHYILGIFD